MIKRSFFGIASPKLTYDVIEETQPEPISVSPKQKVTLFIDTPYEKASKTLFKLGDDVKPGQKLRLYEDADAYAISPVSGKIDSIMPFIGIMEKQMTAVTIKIEGDGKQVSDEFKSAAKSPSLETARSYLEALPGNPDFSKLDDVKTIVVLGVENDLLTVTNQSIMKSDMPAVKNGIDILQKISRAQKVLLVVPPHLLQAAGSAGADVKSVDNVYPAASRMMIALDVLADEQSREDSGIAFFSAEAVARIGTAFDSGQLSMDKRITFVKKDGSRHLITAPVGTSVGDIMEQVGERVDSGDRIIFGGPMTGHAIYSLDHPVGQDTDTIIIQDQGEIIAEADSACINCGQCVRVCPTNVPVNELIRYLDAGEYEQAQQRADLDACIECGLCTYVCECRVPIFQFIRLAKHALERMKAAEEANA